MTILKKEDEKSYTYLWGKSKEEIACHNIWVTSHQVQSGKRVKTGACMGKEQQQTKKNEYRWKKYVCVDPKA